jgi:hypothetical protein
VIRASICLGLVLTAIFGLPQALADALKHDPFARPLLSTSLSGGNVPLNASAEDEVSWDPQLIAVMVAGKNSIVNLDGVILKIGEEIDGFRLVEVRDRKAIFRKGSKRIVVEMEMLSLQEYKARGVK